MTNTPLSSAVNLGNILSQRHSLGEQVYPTACRMIAFRSVAINRGIEDWEVKSAILASALVRCDNYFVAVFLTTKITSSANRLG